MPAKDRVFKSVSFMLPDYDYLEKVRKQWIKQNNVPLSMPQLVKLAASELEAKLK